MTTAPRTLFLADAGPEVGGGHVMRCLTLARVLVERGAECAFVESRAAAPILRRFGWPGQTLLAMIGAEDLAGLLTFASGLADAFDPQLIVVDHYGTGAVAEAQLRAPGRRILVIDDLADRSHDCDFLLDPGFGRRREAYEDLIPARAAALVGPTYAMVRPEFAAARQRALSRRAKHEPVRRALVALGLTDVGAITRRAVTALLPQLGDVRLDVAIGVEAPSRDALARLAHNDRRIHLHIDTDEMASLMADADVAIGAGGSSTWERATVGLPSITVVLADNQREVAQQLAAAGLTLALGAAQPDFERQLVQTWRALADDPALRWRLASSSSDACDGHGAARVADAVAQL